VRLGTIRNMAELRQNSYFNTSIRLMPNI